MSGTRTLLLEIHCEEIPARFLQPLGQEFMDGAKAFLRDALKVEVTPELFHSPRKLAWRIQGLPVQQPDQSETQVGPPQRMCVDEQGQPTQTGLKFAEKWGVAFDRIRFEQPAGKKEPCALVTLTQPGRPTAQLLAEALPRLVTGLHVPKAMRWGVSEFQFVRPIRNVLCLFGAEVVPFQLDGVTTGSTTWGHRLHHLDHPEPVAVAEPMAYEAALEAAGIVASCQERKARLERQIDDLARQAGGAAVKNS